MCRKASLHKSSDRSDGDQIPYVGGIGDLFRDYGEKYIEVYKPSVQKIKLIRSISICKTPLLGGRIIKCKDCGKEKYIFNSCGHSHCMLCQSIKREQWVDKLKSTLLDVPYVHMTFTLPHELNMLAKLNQKTIYSLIQKVAWKTITAIGKEQGATYGMTSVLHTFGSDIKYHVHVHTLVTFGGIKEDGSWHYPKTKNKIERYRRICAIYKAIFIEELLKEDVVKSVKYPQDYKELIAQSSRKRWVVHSTYPTMDTNLIQNYLGRYINRVAITNNRLIYIKKTQKVSLTYNDYTNQQSGEAAPKKIKTLNPLSAIHQILQHVLPPYYQKTRRYGIHHSSSKVRGNIPSTLKNNHQTIRTVFEIMHHLLSIDPIACKDCGSLDLEVLSIEIVDKEELVRIFIDSLTSPPAYWKYRYSTHLSGLKKAG